MGYLYSSGNEIVDEVGKLAFIGDIIPHTWYKTILRDNEKPYLNAIIILADITYWYRPSEVREESSGQLLGFKKKFKEDLLQRSYGQMAERFGMSKREATNAIVFLEKLGVIERVFRTVKTPKIILNNVLYINLNVEKLEAITFPEGTLSLSKETGVTLQSETLSPNKEIGIPLKRETNTKNTTKTSNIDFNPIFSEESGAERTAMSNELLEKDKIKEVFKKNIEYDCLVENNPMDKERINGILDLMTDIYMQRDGSILINRQEKSIDIVKSQFMKLNYNHIEYVLNSLNENTTKITKLRSYLLTTLYNAPMTMDQYYRSWANHTLYGDDS
ncbi:MAG: DNA replication protein DnaD [Tissierellia bacterium]|nr:DNA replication protein DnaD [Tissierellia bacterium]